MNIFIFKAKKGEIDFGSNFNLFRFKQELKENEGKIFRIEPIVHTRTLSQNKLYRLLLIDAEIETGQPADDIHEWAKRKFLPPRTIKVNGEEMKIPGDYMDKVSAAVGVPIRDTDSYLREINLAPLK